jgi:hypothetical protein
MKNYDKLQIAFDPSVETYNRLTTILGVQPNDNYLNFPDNIPSSWTYEVIDDKTDEYFDFINVFLDLLETKYSDLKNSTLNATTFQFGRSMNTTSNVIWNLTLKD